MALSKITTNSLESPLNLPASDLAGTLDLSSKTVTLPASAVTAHVVATDTSKLEYNQAILAFKIASSNQLAKFSMVDQVVDEYQDSTGVDAGASTNANVTGSGSLKYILSGTSNSTTYSYTGSNQTWTAPAGVTSITLSAWGAGGGGGSCAIAGSTATDSGDGGGGAGFCGATVTTTPSTTYSILVGQSSISVDSTSATNNATAYGGGGNGGGQASQRLGGTGGGRTEFSIGGGVNVPAGTRILVAAGGGGGSSVYHSPELARDGAGAGGGGTTGLSGEGTGTVPTGGTQSAGGTAGTGNGAVAQAAFAGLAGLGGGAQGSNVAIDVGYSSGGGGGGGFYGGGGGDSAGSSGKRAQGGGGGSSYANTTYCSSITNTAGTTAPGITGGAVANSSASNYPSGIGVGGDGVDTSASTGSEGGHGALVLDYTSLSDATIQSTSTTAETAPTTADLVVLIEDNVGTATVNSDIKGYISRNGTAFSSAVTFVDEGDWGTNKRILVARNVDISGVTTGTSMKYKLTTHNQGSKDTRIHATSLAWA